MCYLDLSELRSSTMPEDQLLWKSFYESLDKVPAFIKKPNQTETDMSFYNPMSFMVTAPFDLLLGLASNVNLNLIIEGKLITQRGEIIERRKVSGPSAAFKI